MNPHNPDCPAAQLAAWQVGVEPGEPASTAVQGSSCRPQKCQNARRYNLSVQRQSMPGPRKPTRHCNQDGTGGCGRRPQPRASRPGAAARATQQACASDAAMPWPLTPGGQAAALLQLGCWLERGSLHAQQRVCVPGTAGIWAASWHQASAKPCLRFVVPTPTNLHPATSGRRARSGGGRSGAAGRHVAG